jgi:hypothetical protein
MMKIKYVIALDGRYSIFFKQQSTNTTEEAKERRFIPGGCAGGHNPIVLAGIDVKAT